MIQSPLSSLASSARPALRMPSCLLPDLSSRRHLSLHPIINSALTSSRFSGTRRPSVKSESLTQSDNVKKWLDNYLWVGEVLMDQSVAIMSTSGYFERKR